MAWKNKDLGIEDIVASIDDSWLKAAEKSLSDNQQSFALLEMRDVLLPSGLLAMLQGQRLHGAGSGNFEPSMRDSGNWGYIQSEIPQGRPTRWR